MQIEKEFVCDLENTPCGPQAPDSTLFLMHLLLDDWIHLRLCCPRPSWYLAQKFTAG